MLKLNPQLITGRGIPVPMTCNSPSICEDNTSFINHLIQEPGTLPHNPPFEIHPYKQDFPLQQFDKYIIGTFPPISYVLDNPRLVEAGFNGIHQPNGGALITPPWIPFYHGNRGSMWDFLLTHEEMLALDAIRGGEEGRQNAKNYLIDFLLQSQINYADIIDSTQRNLDGDGRYTGEDTNLNNICPNSDLICHLLTNPKAKFLLFNTASIFSNQGIKTNNNGVINVGANTKAFDLFVRQCRELGFNIHLQILQGAHQMQFEWTHIHLLNQPRRRTKIAFELKISNPLRNRNTICHLEPGEEKTFTVVTPFSPAAVNRGRTRANNAVANWLANNPGQTPVHLLYMVYQNFRNGDAHAMYQMNV